MSKTPTGCQQNTGVVKNDVIGGRDPLMLVGKGGGLNSIFGLRSCLAFISPLAVLNFFRSANRPSGPSVFSHGMFGG